MKPLRAVLLAAAVLGTGGGNAVQAADLVQQSWQAPGVTQWTLSLTADYVLKQAPDSQIRITAEPKVMRAIAVRIKGNRAEIDSSGSFSTQKKLLVEISAPDFQRIAMHSSGGLKLNGLRGQRLQFSADDSSNATLTRLQLDQLQIELAGSSSVDAGGQTGDQQVKLEDSASYRAGGLQSSSAKVSVSGSADALVAVARNLQANVSDSGTLKYRGKPSIRKQVEDAGTLEQE